MGSDHPDRICYEFFCARFPRCARARGRGCAVREQPRTLDDGSPSQIQPDECTQENDFARFVANPHARIFIHR